VSLGRAVRRFSDNKRIGTNQPSDLQPLHYDFMSEAVYKKQMDQTSITDVPAIKQY
jgi:hypothetical protein